MKDILIRALSGLFYVLLLVLSLFSLQTLIILFFVFGLICLFEFNKLIQLKSFIPYGIFIFLFLVFGYCQLDKTIPKGLDEATQILMVITIFVQLFLIKDLFSAKTIPLFESKRFILTTFYISSAFVFLILIANYHKSYNPGILLGSFILIWVNDSFAFLIGKNFGKQKLFEKISPKKTVEGFLGGLLFSCIASYFIATFTHTLTFTHWLILSIIISVFGTLGDLIESKFKRQANVKDSGNIMPGHGGLLDRLDSIIFATPFIYLFLRITYYVS
ncbi:MAG: phosphatidate cytidylyltransferase [Flavobacteriales bacterium]|nr:phosphatidate cytidylyltransferase [Flavobacteriia bacterium]NCP05487.1 phosphatidate cytidylyltransferase [Flavobacteriales bacterium]PIV92420.1 MAG: phosphatidate cytidylyltransferase [Flavobacteriaceae bacterium CG17_big_fil_post_rev_8_21_14_2_50_33_15]PIY11818.1 MAG: phosphatidate cytidylyltransferase [Flavobacteriaceae bacterium CG_4_10_14_3_um_filter_33_47]PJB16737.1 MAG: phosphatidate cytidylyltransferase [Flavobacteriaceae bacterium CG_4_9_14_3_um_filter_33_16]